MLLAVAIVLALFVLEPPWTWVAISAGVVLELGETGAWVWWSKRRQAAVGAQTLVGRTAVATTSLWPEGQVRIDGELWRARCAGGVDEGTEVVVTGVEGLTLHVEPA